MSDTDTISVSQLIELVRDRPVLWDRQREVYKNRKLTRKAWVEICESLIENYHELCEQEQQAIGRSVISKWANLRDNWLRYWRKRQQFLLNGTPTTSLKKYIHHDQLLFLSKVYDPDCQQEVEEIQVDVDVISDPEMEFSSPGLSPGDLSQNMWSFQDEDNRLSETGHIYFFHSVLPLIKDFDNDQTVDFQMAVFECIKHIRSKTTKKQFHNSSDGLVSFKNQGSFKNQTIALNTEGASLQSEEVLPLQPEEKIASLQCNRVCVLARVNGCKDEHSAQIEIAEKTNNPEDKSKFIESEISFKAIKDIENLNKVVSKLENISKKIAISSLGDSYDRFGRHIVSMLRKCPRRKANFIKKKIIKYTASHLDNKKRLHILDISKIHQESNNQENKRKCPANFDCTGSELSISGTDLESSKHKHHSKQYDVYQASMNSSSEETSLSHHTPISNHCVVKNVSLTPFPETIPLRNQMPYKKR